MLILSHSLVPSHPSVKDNYEFECENGINVNKSFRRTRERKTDSFDDTLDFKDNSGNQTSSSEGGDSKNNSPSSESKSSSEESKSSEESSSSSNRTLTAYEESKDQSKDARQPAA